jgi:uncharacterized coiled-coil protein SlyX
MEKKSFYLFSALILALFVIGGSPCYAASANGLTLISPNGGETISSGSNWTIQWEAPVGAVSFKLTYSVNSGSTWKFIDSGITGSSYKWTVPVPGKTKEKCLVKVTGFNAQAEKTETDESDSHFTILDKLNSDIVVLQAIISDLEARLTAAETTIGALQAQLASAESDIATLDTRMTSSEKNMNNLTTRLTAAEGDIGALGTRVAAAEGSVSSLGTRLTTAEAGINTLDARMTSAQSSIDNLDTRLTTVEDTNTSLQELAPFVTVDNNTMKGVVGPHIIFSGANVHVQSGSGSTNDGGVGTGNLTGRGNLIVGYNEAPSGLGVGERHGSHNLVIGVKHRFSSVGGFVAGSDNTISGPSATVSGGFGNEASGSQSIVSGGMHNTASGNHASISGGSNNVASSIYSSVSGGNWNTASGGSSSVRWLWQRSERHQFEHQRGRKQHSQ